MRVIDTSKLQQSAGGWLLDGERLSPNLQQQVYNGLDCCLTHEIFASLFSSFAAKANEFPEWAETYTFERELQGPALSMMRRGFLVDQYDRQMAVRELSTQLSRVSSLLDQFSSALWSKGLNPNSPKQLQAFFYETLELPLQYKFDRGQKKITTNRKALESLYNYLPARPIINCILEARDLKKQLGVLQTAISPDGRMRSSWSPSATETGRWASSMDAFGEGTNLQNITPKLRRMFVADPGKKLLHVDQEQAESRVVGLLLWALCSDRRYLDACESGDLHTSVARILWPELQSKSDAEQIFYRHFSYRDMAKRGGHLSNYRGRPFVMSTSLQLPIAMCQQFQEQYTSSFGLDKWHSWVATQLQVNQRLTTPLHHSRHFFGNPYAEDVLREAIAYVPQSTVGQLTGRIILAAFQCIPELEPLTNDHDGITWQFDERLDESCFIERVREISQIPISLNGCTITIPLEFSSGWNWASAEKPPFLTSKMIKEGQPSRNPDGLKKWRGSDSRVRTNLLDRRLD